jgi:hypothetical protein
MVSFGAPYRAFVNPLGPEMVLEGQWYQQELRGIQIPPKL